MTRRGCRDTHPSGRGNFAGGLFSGPSWPANVWLLKRGIKVEM